ncbi:P-loop NTPase, partial [Acinetobacter baumannii]|uniref:P-loop NTPase n=1 Tax=Acinetobacter baumannii TaxID=470 RepID=UPI00111277E9
AYGMAVLSLGHVTGDNNPHVSWRGPRATGTIMKFLTEPRLPELDVSMIVVRPGTGDIQLSPDQRIPETGSIIVTTPQ